MSISNIYTFNIDSKLRISGNDSNFNYKINLDNDKRKLITHCAISYISIPKSYYLIDEYNCYFTLFEDNTEIQLFIESGNYTKIQIKNKLKDKLNNGSVNGIIYDVIDAYNDRETGKLKIICDHPEINKMLLFGSEINEIFGFERFKYYNFTSELISEYVMNLNQENTLYIRSNICGSNNNENENNVICVIYCGTSPPYTYITEQYDIIYNMHPYIDNQIFNFSLVNELNQVLNLNSVNMSFILKLFTYTEINKKIDNYINYKILYDK